MVPVLCAQNRYYELVDSAQRTIDSYDGSLDGKISLRGDLQSLEAQNIYFEKVDEIQELILLKAETEIEKNRQLLFLYQLFFGISSENYIFYQAFSEKLDVVKTILMDYPKDKTLRILTSQINAALDVSLLFKDKDYAFDVFNYGMKNKPKVALKMYSNVYDKPFSSELLRTAVKYSPTNVRQYMSTNNIIRQKVMLLDDPISQTFLSIYREHGSASNAYFLLHPIHHGLIDVKSAHYLALSDSILFLELSRYLGWSELLGSTSINKQMEYLALKRVRTINELHDTFEKIRFKEVENLNYDQVYDLIVYGDDELFTSTFLGLFERLKQKLGNKSFYYLMSGRRMHKFRTFLKICANYNVIDQVFKDIELFDRKILFQLWAGNLAEQEKPVNECVAIIDALDNIADYNIRQELMSELESRYNKYETNSYEKKLYDLLLDVAQKRQKGEKMAYEGIELPNFLLAEKMFQDGKNIQQHFFFDDEDGKLSYQTFINKFKKTGWKIIDFDKYIILESVLGKSIMIFANKPQYEKEGQQEIQNLFIEQNRFPDIVVHRGHSYYADVSIESITPSAHLVFLGSCGGYNNIEDVLYYSINAQVISSKQIGTFKVNNELIFILCEELRKGKDIEWKIFWNELSNNFKYDNISKNKFNEYIPPNDNIASFFIKAYRKLIAT